MEQEPEFNFNDPEDLSKVMQKHGVMPGSKRPVWKKALGLTWTALKFSALLYGFYKGGELIINFIL